MYTYGSIERGHTPKGEEINPTLDTLLRIAVALDAPDLFGLEETGEAT